jgi:hypothetical protein
MAETPAHDDIDEDELAEAEERDVGEALPVTLDDEDTDADDEQ